MNRINLVRLLRFHTRRFIGWLGIFFSSLSPVERAIFSVGALLAPTYFIFLQFIDLFIILHAVVNHEPISYTRFLFLITESLLIIWNIYILIRFHSGSQTQSDITEFNGYHDCLSFSNVPVHLLHEEKEMDLFDSDGNIKDTAGISVDEQLFVESLPTALEFLRDKASMINTYHRHHGDEIVSEEPVRRTMTLLELLQDAKNSAAAQGSEKD